MPISVKLQAFEGPLDLLLHLIDQNKIDIYDIPIAEITRQYLDYLQQMPQEDLNLMSEFMVMAATLLDIKCRMLLPREQTEDGEEDPREELVNQLLEYKMYKNLSYQLRDRLEDAGKFLYKASDIPDEVLAYRVPVDTKSLLSDVTPGQLNQIFQSVLLKQENKMDPIHSDFGKIQQEEIKLPEKIKYVRDFARKKHHCSFRNLLEESADRDQMVVTFLAILELMRDGSIIVRQDRLFDEIEIEAAEEGQGL